MFRTLLIVTVMLFTTLCQPQPAEAMWWAWLEKWSGPGPFKAKPFQTYLFTMCLQDQPATRVTQTDTVETILQADKKLALKPSPIAFNNTFHQTRDALARKIDAATKEDVRRRILRSLLANPEITALASVSTAFVTDIYAQMPKTAAAQGPPPPAVAAEPAAPELAAPTQQSESTDAPVVQALGAIYTATSKRAGSGHTHERLVCGYFDFGSFSADADQDPERGFPALTARLYDFGPSARIHDGVDIGGGFGWVRFKGDGVDVKRAAFTPLRVILRPILLALPDEWRQEWMGVFSFYWKETYVWGRLSGADFGVDNGWSENGELIRSYGVNLDATALIPVVTRWLR